MTFQEWVREEKVADGLIRIHKPYGIPSTAVTDMYKRLSLQKVGHGGTLDPLAEGSMLLGIGKGTKLLTKYLESNKIYSAKFLFGAESESGDVELPLRVSGKDIQVPPGKLDDVFNELSKGFEQELPALNASKVKGKKMYELVRSGKTVERKVVQSKLLSWEIKQSAEMSALEVFTKLDSLEHELEDKFQEFTKFGEEVGYNSKKYAFLLEKWKNSLSESRNAVSVSKQRYYSLTVQVTVPKGTYIRSLAQDIAKRLGTCGVLVGLERLSAGNVDSAHSI